MEDITVYIQQFAEYFVMLINVIKEFFASFGGSKEEDTTAAA